MIINDAKVIQKNSPTTKKFIFSLFLLVILGSCVYLHPKSSLITMDTYLSLKIKCAEAGTSITEVCREAGITPQVVLNWKSNEPKQFKTLRKLEKTIQQIRDKRCS